MFILINLLFGLMIDLVSTSNTTTLEDEGKIYQNWTQDFKDKYSSTDTPDTATVQLDKTYGNVKFGLGKVFSLLITGINPFKKTSCDLGDCGSEFQQNVESGLGLLINIINALMVLEIMYVLWSKKYD